MEKAILTVEEFANMEFPKPEFKYWSYDNEYIFCHYEKCHTYDIPISELHSAAGACMWLGQINEKTWASNSLLGEMVQLLNYIVGDLRSLK